MEKICNVDAIELGDTQVFKTSLGQVTIFRTRTNKIFATTAKCPHKGGPLAHAIYDGEKHITCPLHGYTFNVESGICSDETLGRSLKIFKVEVENGEIFIDKAETHSPMVDLEAQAV